MQDDYTKRRIQAHSDTIYRLMKEQEDIKTHKRHKAQMINALKFLCIIVFGAAIFIGIMKLI